MMQLQELMYFIFVFSCGALASDVVLTPERSVMPPRIDPATTQFQGTIDIRISCETEGTVIFYTRDGTEPTKRSIRYLGPIQVDSPLIIKARAFLDGYPESDIAEAQYRNLDNKGPSIMKAVLVQGNDELSTHTQPVDTLHIFFDEPVIWNPSDPVAPGRVFRYSTGRGNASLSPLGGLEGPDIVVEDDQSVLIIVSNRFSFSPDIDSIGLVENSDYILDVYGNRPPGEHSVPIERAGGSVWSATAGVDPLTLGTSRLKVRIEIDCSSPVTDASVSIYDAVGNCIVEDLNFVDDPGRSCLYAIWNGRNLNGRIVGSGTYIAFVTARDSNGQARTQRLKIGLRR
ncbi:MAG: hypothetical protein GF350_05855 [Chitinivibrionales bacterium]|nr:hypothetical protein [Chitinivibrionales bacterium]